MHDPNLMSFSQTLLFMAQFLQVFALDRVSRPCFYVFFPFAIFHLLCDFVNVRWIEVSFFVCNICVFFLYLSHSYLVPKQYFWNEVTTIFIAFFFSLCQMDWRVFKVLIKEAEAIFLNMQFVGFLIGALTSFRHDVGLQCYFALVLSPPSLSSLRANSMGDR
jgi:hypothetical protein